MSRLLVVLSIVAAAVTADSAVGARNGAKITSWGAKKAPGVASIATSYMPPAPVSNPPAMNPVLKEPGHSATPPVVRILPLSCLGSTVNADALIVSLNRNSCVAAATPEPPAPDPAAPLPSPVELAWIAADRAMSLAEWPELRVAPRRIGLTGLPTFIWLRRSPRPVTASASVPGLTVTALAEPVEFRWDFGEGATRRTSHSGRAWTRRSDGNISHTYERRGSRYLGVDVVWQARWRINTGAWQHLGYFSNHDSRRYRVRQMVAMLSRTRGR